MHKYASVSYDFASWTKWLNRNSEMSIDEPHTPIKMNIPPMRFSDSPKRSLEDDYGC